MDMKPDYAQLLALARSPEGQQLLTLLQRSGGKELDSLVRAASAGDYQTARTILASLLSGKEAEDLLKKMEGRL